MSFPRRRTSLLLGCAAVLTVVVPAHAAAAGSVAPAPRAGTTAATPRVPTAVASSSAEDGSAPTTSVEVESGGPLKEVGPILVPGDGSGVSSRWWLMAFGGVQIVGLFLITRRARARLSTGDAQP